MRYDKKVLIIFDSNYLYGKYDKKANFNEFSFNQRFDNFRSLVEVNNLEEKIIFGLSEVVIEELMMHKIEAYYEEMNKIENLINNFSFPNYSMSEIESNYDYHEFLKKKKNLFIESIQNNIIESIILPIPNQISFPSIIKRAFEKRAPFEGVNGKGDKGFKDALFWESILEFKINQDISDIIVCTSDKRMINQELINEYKEYNLEADLQIVNPDKLNTILEYISNLQGNTFVNTNVDNAIIEFIENDSEWKDEFPYNTFIENQNSECRITEFNIENIYEVSSTNYKVILNIILQIIDGNNNILNKKLNYILNLKYVESVVFYIGYSDDWSGENEQLAST